MKYTFTPQNKTPRYASYRIEALWGMTLLQLRDICAVEGLVNAAIDRLDREELIQIIMTFRGARERLLLHGYDAEKLKKLTEAIKKMHLISLPHDRLQLPSKLSLFNGLDTGYFDDYRVSYQPDLEVVNAFVLDQENGICAVLRLISFPGQEDLFLTRLVEFPCNQADVRDYRLLLCPQKFSDQLTAAYNQTAAPPTEAQAYIIPLLAYEVCDPIEAAMPLAIDFGTTNTAAGIYLSRLAYDKIARHIKPGLLQADSINYLRFLSPEAVAAPILPTVISVDRIQGDQVTWRYGFDADGMMAQGYLGQGVCVFYDIKRWSASYEEAETLTDSQGHQLTMPRKQIIKAYFDYIISSAQQQFKCKFNKLFLSYPVKQRERFISLYREIYADYDLMESEMFDEGIAVLYSIIGMQIDKKNYREDLENHALIMDCGGGTTDQSSASFRIRTGRAAFEIDITTAYENGDTNFGGNNLTFRLMQLLKIEIARQISGSGKSLTTLTAALDFDQYRAVDDLGRDAIYREIEETYQQAENLIPTRYREYEYSGREEYYKVYNNFHYLFMLAERVKKAFFANAQILRITVTSEQIAPQPDTTQIEAQRWKLAVKTKGQLQVRKHIPLVSINTRQVQAVFQADIYDIVRRFIGRLYAQDQLDPYKIIKLTGQSCKIGLFRDAVKEYVPGALIRQEQGPQADNYRLKLTCLDGAIRYLRDQTLGLAKVNIHYGRPAIPYVLTAYTHQGEPVTLIQSLDRHSRSGSVSRNIAASEVELTLSDAGGHEKYKFLISCDPDSFQPVTYEEIENIYGEQIPQAEVDVIENGEVCYFVLVDEGQWGFSLVPISRHDETLQLGPRQLHSFENDSWMVNYFDGLH